MGALRRRHARVQQHPVQVPAASRGLDAGTAAVNAGGTLGAPLPRREDARVLRGEARYLDDLEPDGTVHAAFVRSPFAAAELASVSVGQLPDGVRAVLTSTDLPGLARFPVMEPHGAEVDAEEAHPVLAEGEVRYVGQPVAIVL